MLFSVLIPVYYKEQPEFLTECLESILNQTFKPAEIVIVKDGPLTTGLDNCINSFSVLNPGLFKIISLNENKGVAAALEYGLQNCTYEWVARMDADDICLPQRFEKQLNYLKNNPEIDIIGSAVAEFDGTKNNIYSIRLMPVTHNKIAKFTRYRCPFMHMTVLFKKTAVIKAGGYQAIAQEDYYLWGRMLMNGAIMHNLPDILVLVRGGKNMLKRRRGYKYLKEEIKLQFIFYKINLIKLHHLIFNITIRGIMRLIPLSFMEFFYTTFLRKSKKNLPELISLK